MKNLKSVATTTRPQIIDGRPIVGGVVSVTTVDYPDHVAAVVFLQGCCWRCGYCHNKHLWQMSVEDPIPWDSVVHLLETRVGFIEAVVLSGGEPLVHDTLSAAVADIKKINLLVGLHTGGAHPEVLRQVLHQLDWVGFDVKYSFDKYHMITNVENSGVAARKSLEMLIDAGVNLEVRITVCESIDMPTLSCMLDDISSMGVKTVVLQKCRDKNENIVEHPVFSAKLLLDDMRARFDNFHIR